MEETKTEKSVLYKHFSLYFDHNSSSNLSQRAIAHEIFEPFFTIGRAKRTKNMVPPKRHHIFSFSLFMVLYLSALSCYTGTHFCGYSR